MQNTQSKPTCSKILTHSIQDMDELRINNVIQIKGKNRSKVGGVAPGVAEDGVRVNLVGDKVDFMFTAEACDGD